MTSFGELSMTGTTGRHTWVMGGALQREAFDPLDVQRFAYTYTTPGVFGQDDVVFVPWLTGSGSVRSSRLEAGPYAGRTMARMARSLTEDRGNARTPGRQGRQELWRISWRRGASRREQPSGLIVVVHALPQADVAAITVLGVR